MAEEVIVLTDLTKKYGAFTAVDRICLSVAKGEVFGLLGAQRGGQVDYHPHDARTDRTDVGQCQHLRD